MVIELVALLKKKNADLATVSQQVIDYIIKMISLIFEGKINGKQAKTIFEKIVNESKDPEKLIDELGFKQITDEKQIEDLLTKIVEQNKSMLDQYNDRPERVEKFFIGQLMKETHGQANPVVSMKVLKRIINK
ncbi:MAG: hypothetical protein K2M43_01665 [Mycoplasmoidaceae bacterium]|nr:hypothetical protein [Mycoplasmoidaceae bacterium]